MKGEAATVVPLGTRFEIPQVQFKVYFWDEITQNNNKKPPKLIKIISGTYGYRISFVSLLACGILSHE